MRDLSKMEMDKKYCKECDHCKRSNGKYYCEKGKCPFSDEDIKEFETLEGENVK